jgi:phospholipid transport system substrate-binding protein
MFPRIIRAASGSLFAVALLFWHGAGAAANPQDARAFIDNLGAQTIDVLQRENLGTQEAVEIFREMFRESFDSRTIGRFVLGRYWRTATPEQQREYLRLFEEMIVQTYARRFTDYAGESLDVLGARPEGEVDAMVNSRVVRPDGPPVNVTWRVRESGGTYKIIDVIVEGVSMSVTQRNEFSAVIQRNGGQIEPLLDALREQIEAAQNI